MNQRVSIDESDGYNSTDDFSVLSLCLSLLIWVASLSFLLLWIISIIHLKVVKELAPLGDLLPYTMLYRRFDELEKSWNLYEP